MFEVNSDILILAAGLIIGLLILKLLTKFLFRIIGVIILLALGIGYSYFYTDFFEENKDNIIVQNVEGKINFLSVIEYQQEHCIDGPKSRNDSITCECIIEPIVEDLRTKYTGEEIDEIVKDRKRYLKEILAALRRNQDEILQNLKERNAIDIWNNMVRNLRKGKFIGEYSD